MQRTPAGDVGQQGQHLVWRAGAGATGAKQQAQGAVGGDAQALGGQSHRRVVGEQDVDAIGQAQCQGVLFTPVQGVERPYSGNRCRGYRLKICHPKQTQATVKVTLFIQHRYSIPRYAIQKT